MKRGEGVLLTQLLIEQKEVLPVLDVNLKHDILKELQPQVLGKIKKGFDLYKGSVNSSQFIVIMVDVLFQQTNWKKYAREILTFIELFLLIDLKHLQKIKFEDFTNYLIDREQGTLYKEEFQFVPAKLNELDLPAERVFKLEGSPNLAILANGKKNVEILQKKSYKRIDHLTCGGPLINNVIFLEKYRVYCLASNDKYLSFYQNVDHTLVRRFSVPDNIYFLQLFGEGSYQDRLICASTNGHIYQFALSRILSVLDKKNKEGLKQEERRIKELKPEHQYKFFSINKVVQSQPDITCIDVMEALDILVTGANDSRVRLYQMRDNGLHLSKELDGHYKGIKGVAVSIHHKLIVSCSFDFDILVWNAYLQHPVARLEGHQAPLMNVQCPKKYQIIISMDAKSIMKIWSSENYQLLQNIVIYQNFPANTTINITYKNQSNLAMIWTKKVRFYEYVVNYDPKLTDDHDITAIKYSSKNLQVYIGSRKSLKVWSITKGIQTKNYKNLVKGDISIIQLDNRERRCFLGTIDGQIISIDLFSGLIINVYSSHSHQISLLIYNNKDELLISGGWDKRIKIHNDTHRLQRIQARENVMRNINNVSQKELSGGSFSLAQLFIATFFKTNLCQLWDFEKGFLESQILIPNEISAVMFIDPLPLLVLVDIKGTIYLFSTKYHLKNPYKLLTQWKNMYSIQKSSQITYVSSHYEQNKDTQVITCQLILGDEFGYIRIVDISGFIYDKDIKPVTSQMIGNKNPYRIQDYNYIGTGENSSNTHDFSHHESNNIVPPGNIKQKLQIRGHTDRVTYVALINQSSQKLIISAGSDNLVKIWNSRGQPRGVMRQGITENKNWSYEIHQQWSNKETTQYLAMRKHLNATFEDYLYRKRLENVPFTDENIYQEINNDEIYKDLREVEGYLQKSSKKATHRLY